MMDNSNQRRCENCAYARNIGFYTYECRRRSPSVVQTERRDKPRGVIQVWPEMDRNDWCGDFEAKIEPQPVETPEHLLLEQRTAQLAEENERLTLAIENMSAEAALGVSAATMGERCRCIGACLSEQLPYQPETEAELAYMRAISNCIEAIRADPRREKHD